MGQPSLQPSSTAAVQGNTVSYPQQLWQPDSTMDTTACHAALQLFCTLSSIGPVHVSCAYVVLLVGINYRKQELISTY